ncbi:MAG: MaoC family dehydratase [Propioniciclava sp.]
MVETLVFAEPPAVGALIVRGVLTRRRAVGKHVLLPDRILRLPQYRSPIERFAAYTRVCGFPLADRAPATWVHVVAFPLQAALLAEPDFPFPPAGLVHLRNAMILHRPIAVTDSLDLLVRPGDLRPHPRGHVFDVISEARVGNDLAWSGVSTYLARSAATADEPAEEDRRPAPGGWPRPAQRWRLPADLGRRYAAVSGDINPIHLSPVTARLFGYRRPLAHGMWTQARALAAFGHLPECYTVSVAFHRPVLLPATVGFAGERRRWAVLTQAGKELLTGAIISP